MVGASHSAQREASFVLMIADMGTVTKGTGLIKVEFSCLCSWSMKMQNLNMLLE